MSKPKITICMGSSCFARGNEKNVEFCEEFLAPARAILRRGEHRPDIRLQPMTLTLSWARHFAQATVRKAPSSSWTAGPTRTWTAVS